CNNRPFKQSFKCTDQKNNSMKISRLTTCALLCTHMVFHAQDVTKSVIKRTYTTQSIKDMAPPIVDGVLEESTWAQASWEGGFIEQRPDENTAPDHQTQFKILYDKNSLYVGIRCYDS